MWQTILLAFGLLLVIEGVLPALNPDGYRRAIQTISSMDDRVLRTWGLISMSAGAILIYLFTT
jgi:uncharacterized protein YjeT (DUF2065 family)